MPRPLGWREDGGGGGLVGEDLLSSSPPTCFCPYLFFHIQILISFNVSLFQTLDKKLVTHLGTTTLPAGGRMLQSCPLWGRGGGRTKAENRTRSTVENKDGVTKEGRDPLKALSVSSVDCDYHRVMLPRV